MQKRAETFVLHTTQGTCQAATVIVATGPFHHPSILAFASALSPQVEQLHSAAYRNPFQIPPGPVLVVGRGDSGAHIAAELAHAHPVSLAAAHPLYFVPLTLLGKSLFCYLDRLHLLEVDGTMSLGAWLKAQPELVLGLELKQALRERQVRLRPRATSAQDNVVQFADGSQTQMRTVIWATGYRQGFSWIHMPEGAGSAVALISPQPSRHAFAGCHRSQEFRQLEERRALCAHYSFCLCLQERAV